MYNKFLKRFFDICLAFVFLIALTPILILVTILCLFFFKGTVLFTQKRVGKNEKVFTIFKFITMRPMSTKNNTDKTRITGFGKILRSSSLDELPQLINVLKGDMSIIGPRPLLVKYLPYYTPDEKIRHYVRPGLTGLSQITGRNNLNWNDRLQLDIQYVKNLSLVLDLKIFIKTFLVIFSAENIQPHPSLQLKDLDEERREMQLGEENKT